MGVWFYIYNDYDDTTWKLKAEFDKESKILTVCMPENFLNFNEGNKIMAYTSKKLDRSLKLISEERNHEKIFYDRSMYSFSGCHGIDFCFL